jgi:hypothetical protein
VLLWHRWRFYCSLRSSRENSLMPTHLVEVTSWTRLKVAIVSVKGWDSVCKLTTISSIVVYVVIVVVNALILDILIPSYFPPLLEVIGHLLSLCLLFKLPLDCVQLGKGFYEVTLVPEQPCLFNVLWLLSCVCWSTATTASAFWDKLANLFVLSFNSRRNLGSHSTLDRAEFKVLWGWS